MSKRNNNKQQKPAVPTAKDVLKDLAASEKVEEATDTTSEDTPKGSEEETAPTAPAAEETQEAAPVEQTTQVSEEPTTPAEETTTSEPAPTAEQVQEEVPQPKVNKHRRMIMSSELLSSGKGILARRRMAAMRGPQTQQGVRLAALFDEYEAMMRIKTDDIAALKKRIVKLQEIMNAACAIKNEKSIRVTEDLIRVVFDRFTLGWGTLYSEATIFKRDYRLNNPGAIDKLNAFWTAMIQLVEASTEGEKIRFDSNALALVIDNKNVMTVIRRLRESIEQRNLAG